MPVSRRQHALAGIACYKLPYEYGSQHQQVSDAIWASGGAVRPLRAAGVARVTCRSSLVPGLPPRTGRSRAAIMAAGAGSHAPAQASPSGRQRTSQCTAPANGPADDYTVQTATTARRSTEARSAGSALPSHDSARLHDRTACRHTRLHRRVAEDEEGRNHWHNVVAGLFYGMPDAQALKTRCAIPEQKKSPGTACAGGSFEHTDS